MPTPILMPALSPTMEEGTLSKWKIKEGDKVSSGDIIAEIETDKATMEVEAVDEGVVGKILVPAGTEHVKVNAQIAILLEEGESADAAKAPAKPNGGGQAAKPSAAEQKPAPATAPAVKPAPAAPSGAAAPAPAAPARAATAAAASATVATGTRIFASPLAKRIAKTRGFDLSPLKGTGPHGRIVMRDLEKVAAPAVGAAPAAGATASAVPKPGPAAAKPAAAPGAPTAPAAPGAPPLDPQLYPPEGYTAVKLDGMRKVIARRLKQSFNDEVPHFPLNIDCELTHLMAARAALNALSPKEGEGAFKLSVNDFVIKASALALMKVPAANATFTEQAILLHKYADIGIAVAIEGGLITPIVRRAETKGLKQISLEMKDYAARARARKLKPEEYMGGTFSVSNLGMFGITSFASIVNQPQGAILSVGAGEERAVVRGGAVAVRTMMTVTLTCDHRVVDGSVGAEFLGAFKRFIEEPAAMLL